MRRLTVYIKTIAPFPAELQIEFFKIVKVLQLMPGEWIPDDLPSGTSIFVEEGFLLLTTCTDNQWKCSNFYVEGFLALTYSEGAPEMREGSFRVRAAEPSLVYYLTVEEEGKLKKIFPNWPGVSRFLRQRSFLKNQGLISLFRVPPTDRIIYADKHFGFLFRAPLQDLIDFLDLQTEAEKVVLDFIQRERHSPNKQLLVSNN